MKVSLAAIVTAVVSIGSIAVIYIQPMIRTAIVAVVASAPVSPAAAQASASNGLPSTVHIGTEIYTATDHGSGEAANYDYVIGDGSDLKLLGIYGNAALDNAKPDANDREFLFSISSASNTGSAQLASVAYAPSHHSADSAIYAGILKQAGSSNATLPINVTFPGGGIPLARGAVRVAAITGVYDPNNGFEPINTNATNVLSSELHLTFVYTR